MDYQRACGVTGRSVPMRMRGNQPWQIGCQYCDQSLPRNTENGGTEYECPEQLAIVTSPVQCWQNLYTPCEALAAGTLFKCLNLPLVGCGNGYCPRRMGGLQ